MKRLFVFILLLVYFTVNTGFVVNLHYCMDKIAGIELNGDEHDTCGKCGMSVKDREGCCREEVKVVKLHQDVLVAYTIVPQFLSVPAVLPTSDYLATLSPVRNLEAINRAHAPPLISKQDTYLKICVFRI